MFAVELGQAFADARAATPALRQQMQALLRAPGVGVVQGLRDSHGGFAAWLDAHQLLDGKPRDKAGWVKLFKRTFRSTGGEITGEFLMSLSYLPGAHRESCPAYRRIEAVGPYWRRAQALAGGPRVASAKTPRRGTAR